MKVSLIYAFLLCCALLAAGTASGQRLKGLITDSLGKPVAYAGINLKGSNNLIVAYTASSNDGTYTLDVPAGTSVTDLFVEVSCIGYQKQHSAVSNLTQPYNFKLLPASYELQTVTVKDKTPRLRVNGDTLNYKVADFVSPQDRVIGDVIRKLPGVEMDAAGKIKYNGKAISNFYIGGDNLLDDKYNIATSTIPSSAVDKVQVMENHQPVKMLKDKVVSDDVALNITLKDEAKLQLLGQAAIGGGLPGKYDENISAMMFKDKYKAINYFKGNNTGIDVAADLTSHNMASYLNRIDNNKPAELLSLGAAGNPDLPVNRYLFNQSALLNFNNLLNLQKDVQVRANISYLRDAQRQYYQKLNQTYLPNDTITYTETQANKRRPDLLHAQLTLNMNKDKYFLNNVFIGDLNYNRAYSALNANGSQVNQNLKQNAVDFANEFSYLKTMRSGNIINYYAYLNHISQPENRVIEPGLNPGIFNNGQPYAQLVQQANIPTWFTHNYFSFRHPGKKLTQQYKAGFSLQSQQLNSSLYSLQLNNSMIPATDSAVNHLNWQRRKLYAETGFEVPGRKLSLTVNLPVVLQQTHYQEDSYQLNESSTRLYINPQLAIKYQTGTEQYLTLNYALRNNIGDINDVYRGYVLKNYRTLYANNAGITESRVQNAIAGYNYRKAIRMLFWGINAAYTHTQFNNIAYSNITPNLQQRVVLPYENSTSSWTLSGSVSKYSFDLHTTFSTGALWQSTKLNQIINRALLPYQTRVMSANVATDTKLIEMLNFSYKVYYTRTSSASPVSPGTSFNQLQHKLAVNFNPADNLFLTLSGDNYYIRQPLMKSSGFSFADFTARYRFIKKKLDIELNALNLFNTKTYSNAYLTANMYTTSTYRLPGRMIIGKVTFNY